LANSKLDKDLKRIDAIADATQSLHSFKSALAISGLFMICVLAFTLFMTENGQYSPYVIIAGVIGGYMAMNIGANDVANNVGPAVGSRALSMTGALIIAAVCEASGAILAGGDVVKTISKGIINPDLVSDPNTFILAMMSALLAAALWVNIATWFGAPVSTTHSVVGGVMGAGLVAAGPTVVSWGTMQAIAASWVLSPVLGGAIAAGFLAFIKKFIIYKEDRIASGKKWIPMLIAILAACFTMYLMKKGLKKIYKPSWSMLFLYGAAAFAVSWALVRPIIAKQASNLENRRKDISKLFTIPLIFSAALLSFAHGANDVANAVGPLAAIVHTAGGGAISAKVTLPSWILVIGALGIAVGLAMYGPKLIRTVGEKITKLDQTRAFCVALSAALTVLVASALGLPVSSTHIAVGGVFGVGFFREYWTNTHRTPNKEPKQDTSIATTAAQASLAALIQEDTKDSHKKKTSKNRRLVRRRHLRTIVAAWLITVPLSAAIAAALFFGLHTFAPTP